LNVISSNETRLRPTTCHTPVIPEGRKAERDAVGHDAGAPHHRRFPTDYWHLRAWLEDTQLAEH